MEKPQNKINLKHPRCWLMWLPVFILWLFSKLPYHCQFSIGKALGLLAMKVLPARKRIARINIEHCFPELSVMEVEKLVRDSFIALGQGVLTSGLAWWGSDRRIKKLINNVSGKENLQQAFAQHRGVILLTCHFSAAEIGARMSALLCPNPLNIMHRQQNNLVFEHVLQKRRRRYIKEVILGEEVRKMIKALKNNEGVFYLPDQNFEREHSIFVLFMGVNTLTLTATARFARMNNCTVLPCFCFQRADGKGFDVEYQPLLENYPSGNERDDAIHINQVFEKAIRKHPAQYFWVHRRFKIRPEGEENIY